MAMPTVSAFLATVIHDFRDRDDVLQNTAVAVIESFDRYDPSRPFVAWAIGVARNQVGLYLRRRQRDRLVFDNETVEALASAFVDISAESNQQAHFLTDCMMLLEKRSRQLLELRYAQDLKPAAISKLLDMSANAIAKALQRIRDQLRSCLDRKAAEAS